MNHRIFILGSSEEFIQLVKLSKARGICTIVCDGNPDGPAKKEADIVYDVDVRSTEKIAEICRKERVDGILTAFSDLLLECMVKIAAKAGLPCYLIPEQLKFYRDKSVMKKIFVLFLMKYSAVWEEQEQQTAPRTFLAISVSRW